MPRFVADPDALRDAVEQMAGFGAHLESALDDARSRVDALHAVWVGNAADAHRAVHQHWQHGAQEMHDALGVLRAITATAAENYSSAASANASMWAL